jgi:tetrahydromethanopterin S-methyltransferase subunit G
MADKKVMFGAFLIIIIISILNVSIASAITGKIGNAKMNIVASVGDEISRSIRVINDDMKNNVSLDIEIFASGDLAKEIIIIDNNFTLAPGEEKNANFKIKVTKTGVTITQLNIKFTPPEGSGVVMPATVRISANGTSIEDSEDILDDVGDSGTNPIGDGLKKITGKFTGKSIGIKYGIGITITLVMVIVFIIVIMWASKRINSESQSAVNNAVSGAEQIVAAQKEIYHVNTETGQKNQKIQKSDISKLKKKVKKSE